MEICNDLVRSKYFSKDKLGPVNLDTDYELDKLKASYADVFSRIFVPTNTQKPHTSLRQLYKYENNFAPRTFEVTDFDGSRIKLNEHVFACLMKRNFESEIFPYYVSTEYNVVGADHTPRAGHFVFTERGQKPYYFRTDVFLIEEPAKIHEEPEFNVELRYLERRENHNPSGID